MYTLAFSHIVDGHRVPLVEDGVLVTLQVESPSKTAAISDPKVVEFCTTKGNDCRVRSVL